MTVELNEYKKRVTLMASSRSPAQGPPRPFGQAFVNNINDVNFQFEFPKFGALPGPAVKSDGQKSSSSGLGLNRINSDQLSPRGEVKGPHKPEQFEQLQPGGPGLSSPRRTWPASPPVSSPRPLATAIWERLHAQALIRITALVEEPRRARHQPHQTPTWVPARRVVLPRNPLHSRPWASSPLIL